MGSVELGFGVGELRPHVGHVVAQAAMGDAAGDEFMQEGEQQEAARVRNQIG